jgi:hypothetical protein
MATLSGGQLLESALNELSKKVTKASTLSVGFLEGASYPSGEPVAMIAAIQEFGAPSRNIPPRPFFRNMIADHSPEWPDAVATVLKANDYNAEQTLMQVGEGIKGELQDSISSGNFAPLSPKTVERKGFDTPLIDTSHMRNSVDYTVK